MQVTFNPPILDREHCPGWLLQPMSKKYVSIWINYHPRQDRKRTSIILNSPKYVKPPNLIKPLEDSGIRTYPSHRNMREPLVDRGVSIESLANRHGTPVAKRFARFRLKPTDHLKKSPIGPLDLQMGQDGQANWHPYICRIIDSYGQLDLLKVGNSDITSVSRLEILKSFYEYKDNNCFWPSICGDMNIHNCQLLNSWAVPIKYIGPSSHSILVSRSSIVGPRYIYIHICNYMYINIWTYNIYYIYILICYL